MKTLVKFFIKGGVLAPLDLGKIIDKIDAQIHGLF